MLVKLVDHLWQLVELFPNLHNPARIEHVLDIFDLRKCYAGFLMRISLSCGIISCNFQKLFPLPA